MGKLDKNLQYIWRLEHSDGRGVYTRLKGAKWMGAGHRVIKHNVKHHPVPFNDCLIMDALKDRGVYLSDHYFGFSSIRKLEAWVHKPEWLLELHKYGIKLTVYVCPRDKVIEGQQQTLFSESIRKRQYDLARYFKIKP